MGHYGIPKIYPNLNPAAAIPVDREQIFRLRSFADNYRMNRGKEHGQYVPNSRYVFVTMMGGETLIHPRYRHPALSEGKPVLYAGEASFNNGQLEWWSNGSGNYRPDADHAEQAGLPMEQFYPYEDILKGVHKREKFTHIYAGPAGSATFSSLAQAKMANGPRQPDAKWTGQATMNFRSGLAARGTALARPPVYRPMAALQRTAAPPVYRPQSSKFPQPQSSCWQFDNRLSVPPVYHPQPLVSQSKLNSPGHASSHSVSPSVYRPCLMVSQPKLCQTVSRVGSTPFVFKPHMAAKPLPVRAVPPPVFSAQETAMRFRPALYTGIHIPRPEISKQPVRLSQQVIQRDIGFEYETGADTYLAAATLTTAERQTAAFPAGATPLLKGTTIVGNMAGLHAKSDLGGAGLGSNLEFETDAFPETPAGRARLSRALDTLERFCLLLNTKHANQPHFKSTHLAAAFGGNAPVANRYIFVQGNITGNPQASVGVRLDRIAELMERTVGGPIIGPHAIVPATVAAVRVELGIQGGHDSKVVGNAPEQVRQGIANYVAGYAGVAPLPGGFPSHELLGLCSLLLSYIVVGARAGQQYAKQIAPLMARTDFGSIFTSDLPALEQNFLSAGAGAEFLAMWTHILTLVGVPGGIGGQLFVSEPLSTVGMGLNISTSLTRQAWLAGISQNNDLLTPTTFPSALARPQLFGLGAMGTNHDVVDPTGATVNGPILELRRIAKTLTPHDFSEMALGIFDYIVGLNSAAAGMHPAAYGRVPRPAIGVKRWQKAKYRLRGGR